MKGQIKKLLIWSQKYTRADMLYIARGGFWVTFGKASNTILSLVLIVAFANLLPKETYGIYRYILSIAGVLSIFTLTGMNSAVVRAVASGNEASLRSSIRYQSKWNLLMVVAFFVLSGYYYIQGDYTLFVAFGILGIFVPGTLVLNTYGAYLTGKRKFATANIASVISTSAYVCGSIVALLISGEVVWLVAAYAVTTFVSALFFYCYVLRTFHPPQATSETETNAYGRNLSFIGIIGPIASQIDKIILAHFWGPAQLATYSLAMAIPSRGVPALKRYIHIGSPKFATKTPQEINTVFYRRIFQGMGIGAIATLLYTVLSPLLFTYLLPQYLDGILYSQILSISFIFAMPTRYIGLLFESQKMTTYIFANTVINNTIAIALYCVLGIYGGIMGLVLAQVLWSLLGLLVNFVSWQIASKLHTVPRKSLET